MKIRNGNMQEDYHEFLEETMILLVERVKKKYPNDINSAGSMLFHITDSIFCTLMHWCDEENRKLLVKELADRFMKNIIEFQGLENIRDNTRCLRCDGDKENPYAKFCDYCISQALKINES